MGIDGKRRLIKHNSGFAANLSESLCLLRRHLPLKRETTYQPAAHPSANLRRLAAPPPSRGRRLTISGSAADGILMTLSTKRAINATRGPFPGKGLPTGLGLADGKRRRL